MRLRLPVPRTRVAVRHAGSLTCSGGASTLKSSLPTGARLAERDMTMPDSNAAGAPSGTTASSVPMLVTLVVGSRRQRGLARSIDAGGATIEVELDVTPGDVVHLECPLAGAGGKPAVCYASGLVESVEPARGAAHRVRLYWLRIWSLASPDGVRAFLTATGAKLSGWVQVVPGASPDAPRRFVYTFPEAKGLLGDADLDTAMSTLLGEARQAEARFAAGAGGVEMAEEDATAPPRPPADSDNEAAAGTQAARPPAEASAQSAPSASPQGAEATAAPAQRNVRDTARSQGRAPSGQEGQRENERRRSQRVVVMLEVAYAIKARHFAGYLTDISRHGAYIQTSQQLPAIGSIVTIAFPRSIARGGVRRVRGRVVRKTTGASIDDRGFGVEFLRFGIPHMDREFQQLVDRFYDSA